MSSFLAEHGDALIAAAALFVGVVSAVPIDRLNRRREERRERAVWLRDSKLESYLDLLSRGREVHAACEASADRLRASGAMTAAYEPIEDVESRFTQFIRAVDGVRLLPGARPATEESVLALDARLRDLVVSSRTRAFIDPDLRRSQRAAFEAAIDAVRRQVQIELAAS